MIHVGDCRSILRTLPERSVQCCVTSPPYFGLRDYGMAEQIGAEPTPDAFVAELVAVFREVRRVLADDGTLWLNLGDSYCSTDKWGGGGNLGKNTVAPDGSVPSWAGRQKRESLEGVKPKDLIGIPWRVAFALQADGWYLRQEIIWHKPNPMPESVTDRCTKSHEHIFLLTKSARYHFDAKAIAEPLAEASIARGPVKLGGVKGDNYEPEEGDPNYRGGAHQWGREMDFSDGGTRNKRSVWTVATMPFKEAHFATYPPALIEPCILAGSRAGDTVLDPFMGAGTTAVVCESLGRKWIGCELNPAYAAIANKRIRETQPGLPFGAVA